MRPVYKKKHTDYHNFYSSKNIVLNALINFIFGDNITGYAEYMKSHEAGLQSVPISGWKYFQKDRFVKGDSTLLFRHN